MSGLRRRALIAAALAATLFPAAARATADCAGLDGSHELFARDTCPFGLRPYIAGDPERRSAGAVHPALPPSVTAEKPAALPTSLPAQPREEVALVKQAGTYRVPVTINGVIPLPFMVDSGASDVVLPADVVLTLMRTGTLRQADFLGQQNYRLADGTIMPSQTFRLKSLQVGNRMIENVTGSTTSSQGALLLGQSFLSRFGKISFDYGKQILILE